MIKLQDKNLIEFLKHSRNYITASFFLKGLALISIPIVTYLLSPEDYGKVGVITSLTNIFVILLGMNTFVSIIRYYHEPEKRIFDFIWTLVVFLIPLLIVINPLLYYGFKSFLFEKFNISNDVFLGSIISASLFIFTRIYLSYLQTSQQSRIYNTISTLRGFILLVLTISLYYFLITDKYLGRIFAEVSINLVFFVIVLIMLYQQSKVKFEASLLKYSLVFSIPLIPHALSIVFLHSSDRIILNQLRGPEETGYYTFAYQIGLSLEIIILGTNKSWVPMFFKMLKEKKYRDIEELAIKYKKIIFLFAVFLILYVEDVVKLLANKNFHNSLDVIPIILISYCFMFIYTIYGNYALYSKKTLMIAVNTMIAGALNIFLNYLFIPQYGYIAAGISTMVSFLLLMLLHFFSSKYILSIRVVNLFKLLNEIIWVFGAYGIILILGNRIENAFIIHFVKIVYILIVILFMYPKTLEKLRKV